MMASRNGLSGCETHACNGIVRIGSLNPALAAMTELIPATACIVQQQLGATKAAAFDLEAACSGFIYALEIGRSFIASGVYKNILIIGAEKLSTIIDWEDRNTCVLFGDGAGAAVLQRREGARGVLTTRLGSDGSKADILAMPGGGCRQPPTVDSVKAGVHHLKMEGKEVYKAAVNAMTGAAREVLTYLL